MSCLFVDPSTQCRTTNQPENQCVMEVCLGFIMALDSGLEVQQGPGE
ncbi:hypothetical protein PFLL34_00947 [Pseudomonas fluorescens]|jgi:hypothetical protein|uniref:Uncharacterized protein n=1 Tax=Pseudomonas fluorescens TaxID=294 RepID=A0A109L2Q9_PSEFL|nr:hypothetical protein PFL603g_03735 [Pseudomonas fluorescens]CAH0193446.1 hypothetical protein SRABI111_01739 [Pseudomonas carnis]KWV79922.1 hypothetical protein PFLL34_00947 [Pseudomonas fluorescens]CAH0197229.1 hypothetical protein SRABI64_01643 [Pseudomonas carnis]CAH0218582.1 hypothetical protein SRABI110_02424 [Pseudomonas carnis]